MRLSAPIRVRSFLLTAALLAVAATVLANVTTLTRPPGASQTPGGIALDAEGNVYSADFGGSNVFKIAPDGTATAFLTNQNTPSGNAFDSRGNFYQSNFRDNLNPNAADTIVRVSPRGRVSTFATGLNGPVGIAVDAEDTLYVAMCQAQQVWRVTQDGTASVFATSALFNCPNGIVFDDLGDLYVVNFNDGNVLRIQPDATVSVFATLPGGGNGHVTYVAGDLYAADFAGNRIYRVSVPKGKVVLFAGNGGVGALDGSNRQAQLASPNAVARNREGTTIFVNVTGGLVRAIDLKLRKPARPKSVRARAGEAGEILLSWRDGSRREEGFRIDMQVGGGGFETVRTLPVNTTEATITGLEAGVKHTFRVTAFNGQKSRTSRKVKATPQ